MSSGPSVAVNELPVNFVFSSSERDALLQGLLDLKSNPYREYEAFVIEVERLVTAGDVPPRFIAFTAESVELDRKWKPFVFLQNCPIDLELPVFDYDDPAGSKHRLKKTFVAEGILALVAVLFRTPILAYINVNDGDRFQDIFPKRSLATSQSQKALGPIYFHKDLANHFVRPDFVNMLGIRNSPVNEIYPSFVSNVDVLKALDGDTLAEMRKPQFYTPFDDLTVMAGRVEVGRASDHPLLEGEGELRFFENRTVGLNERARGVVAELIELLHAHKRRVLIQPGDLVSVANNFSVHAKEVVCIRDEEQQRIRWLMKTVNVTDLAVHEAHFVPGAYGVVNG